MDFVPVENTETLPQVAVTLKKQAVFKALLVSSEGKLGDPLLINGEQEFVIEAGKAPETSLVIHKEGEKTQVLFLKKSLFMILYSILPFS